MENERSYSSASPTRSRRTFTKPPNMAQARAHPRENKTHLPDKLREIERSNLILVQHIANISNKGTSFASQNPYYKQSEGAPPMSSAAINRRKKAEKIAAENMAMLKRLQNVRPSLSAKTMEEQHAKNQEYARNMQKK